MLQLSSLFVRRASAAALLMLGAFFAPTIVSAEVVGTVPRQSLVYTSFQPGTLDLYALA